MIRIGYLDDEYDILKSATRMFKKIRYRNSSIK